MDITKQTIEKLTELVEINKKHSDSEADPQLSQWINKLNEIGLFKLFNWNNRAIQRKSTEDTPLLTEDKVDYNPTSTPKSEDTKVWYDLIDRIENQRRVFPNCPRVVKMLKLLKAHTIWFQ